MFSAAGPRCWAVLIIALVMSWSAKVGELFSTGAVVDVWRNGLKRRTGPGSILRSDAARPSAGAVMPVGSVRFGEVTAPK